MKTSALLLLIILSLCGEYGYCQQNTKLSGSYLIVLDVQEQFYSKWPDSSAIQMVRQANAVIGKFEPQHVIYITSGGKALSISLKGIKTVKLPATELDNDLKVVSGNLYEKEAGDAFTVNELMRFLQERNAKDIYIIGLLAEKCIFNTAAGGLARGFEIHLIPDAILGKSLKSKQKAIQKLQKKGALITPISTLND